MDLQPNQITQLFPSELWLAIFNIALLPKLPLNKLLALRTVCHNWKKTISLFPEVNSQGFPHVSRLAQIFTLRSLVLEQDTYTPDFDLFTGLHTLTLVDPTPEPATEGKYSRNMTEFLALTNLTSLTLTSEWIKSIGLLTGLQQLALLYPFQIELPEVLGLQKLTKLISDVDNRGILKTEIPRHYYPFGRYEGQLKDGQWSGIGKKTDSDGVYEGELQGVSPHGQGKLTFWSGDWYEGPFVDGLFHGEGTYYFVDANVVQGRLEGTYYQGSCIGRVVLYSADGNRYEGELNESSQSSGEGSLFFKNGDIYVGQFDEDRRTGSGTMTYANGDCYVGDWLNGQRHGKGVLEGIDGTRKEGQWKNDQFVE